LKRYLLLTASTYISCYFGRGFDTLHLHKKILTSWGWLDLTDSKGIRKVKRN